MSKSVNRGGWRYGALLAGVIGMLSAPGADAIADEAFEIKGDAAKGAGPYKMYCAACHGDQGKGDGIAAAALNPKPKDLSNRELMAKVSDHEVFIVIRDGGPAAGLSPMMVGWKAILGTDQAVHDVAAFVRTLAKPDAP